MLCPDASGITQSAWSSWRGAHSAATTGTTTQDKGCGQMSAVVTGYRSAKLIGVGCLLVTAVGWGLNWPATKFLLAECPPLTARGISGIVASVALASLAASRGET